MKKVEKPVTLMDFSIENSFVGFSSFIVFVLLRKWVSIIKRENTEPIAVASPAPMTPIEPHAAAVMGMFMRAQTAFSELPEEEQPNHVGAESRDCVAEMLGYVYQHLEPFKLLVCKSQGTGNENFIHNMVEIEVEATQNLMEVLRRQGRKLPELDDQLCHIIASGMFHGIFEVVVHDMPYNRAKHYIQQLQDFYLAGWHSMMGV